ncbi:MAG: hypothetical protein WKF84_05270 [Pyrinomonadaceae bacterium]
MKIYKNSLRRRAVAICTLSFLIVAFLTTATAQTGGNRDVLLVLPFENTAASAEHNWVGAGFADAMTDLLSLPGMMVISK